MSPERVRRWVDREVGEHQQFDRGDGAAEPGQLELAQRAERMHRDEHDERLRGEAHASEEEIVELGVRPRRDPREEVERPPVEDRAEEQDPRRERERAGPRHREGEVGREQRVEVLEQGRSEGRVAYRARGLRAGLRVGPRRLYPAALRSLAMLILSVIGCATSPPTRPEGAPPDAEIEDTSVPDTAGPDDTGATVEDTGPADTGSTSEIAPCEGPDDPERPMGFRDLLARLEVDGCLSDADQAAAVAFVDGFFDTQDVWCDAVYRLSSTDGLFFTGTPELVREHASVADVAVTAEGAHVLVYNDLRPGLFAETLRDDPARFWRQGLIGVGGVGMSIDRGEGFTEAGVDLHLPGLALVVDPDLSVRPAGDYRLVTFRVPAAELDGEQWDPLQTAPPHDYYRAVSPVFGMFFPAAHVLAATTGYAGGADPTVLDVEGGEVLFLGDSTRPLVGWTAPNGQYGVPETPPDVYAPIPASAPNAVVAPDGSYRLYYVDNRSAGMEVATSEDGRTWTPLGLATNVPDVHSPSVVVGAHGTWWLYFGRREETCMLAIHDAE
jgi:hypothetical protein